MNRIKFLFLTVYLIFSQSIFAQADQLYNIRGTVKDDVTQQALIGALVYVVNHENQSTITDENGEFRIEALPLGRHSLQVSYLGYVAYVSNIEIKSGKELVLNVAMKEESKSLDEVVIAYSGQTEPPIPVETEPLCYVI